MTEKIKKTRKEREREREKEREREREREPQRVYISRSPTEARDNGALSFKL